MADKAKHIAFVLGGMSFGGAERVISILANHYAEKGCKVDILTLLKDECDFTLRPEIRLIHFGTANGSRVKNAPVWFGSLVRYMREEKPDAVVSFACRINLFVLAASKLVRRKPRLIVSERNDPKHDTRSLPVQKTAELLYLSADAVVFQTKHAMECFPQRVRRKGVRIFNPVTAGMTVCEEPDGRIAAVGKLMPQKNHSMLIDAFAMIAAEFPKTTLHIYGDGPLRDELQRKIGQLGLSDRAFLEGWHADVAECIRNAGLFVLSSDYEGLSNALMEALAMGMACITTDCAGAEELVRSGDNGVIVPVGDANTMAQAIRTVMRDKEFADGLRMNALVRSAEFEQERVLAEWERVIGF